MNPRLYTARSSYRLFSSTATALGDSLGVCPVQQVPFFWCPARTFARHDIASFASLGPATAIAIYLWSVCFWCSIAGWHFYFHFHFCLFLLLLSSAYSSSSSPSSIARRSSTSRGTRASTSYRPCYHCTPAQTPDTTRAPRARAAPTTQTDDVHLPTATRVIVPRPSYASRAASHIHHPQDACPLKPTTRPVAALPPASDATTCAAWPSRPSRRRRRPSRPSPREPMNTTTAAPGAAGEAGYR